MAEQTSGETSIELLIRLRPATSLCSDCTEKTIVLKPRPLNGIQLKESIEKELQIPVCVQKIFFDSVCITDRQPTSQLYLREKDIVTVEYTTDADTKEVNELIKKMQSVIIELTNEVTRPDLDPCLIEALIQHCFRSLTPERLRVNRLHFIHNHGIETSLSLHQLLSSINSTATNIEMLYLERTILAILCDFSAVIGARYILIEQPNVIKYLCMSVLKKEIVPYQTVSVLVPPDASQLTRQLLRYKNALLVEIMIRAMGVLTK